MAARGSARGSCLPCNRPLSGVRECTRARARTCTASLPACHTHRCPQGTPAMPSSCRAGKGQQTRFPACMHAFRVHHAYRLHHVHEVCHGHEPHSPGSCMGTYSPVIPLCADNTSPLEHLQNKHPTARSYYSPRDSRQKVKSAIAGNPQAKEQHLVTPATWPHLNSTVVAAVSSSLP